MRATILVIEEEPDLSRLFSILLQTEGYNVQIAHDWRAAREMLAEREPDLIIFDWAIANASGYLWADELRTTPATEHIPLLFVCGDQLSRTMMQLLGNIGIPVLEKPFDIFVFRKRINALLIPRERMAGASAVPPHNGAHS
jgi:two-component system phosphate regulon response regulator PhoB